MSEDRGIYLTVDDCWVLYCAAVVGEAHLASELERLGVSTQAESLDHAKEARAKIFAAVEAAKGAE